MDKKTRIDKGELSSFDAMFGDTFEEEEEDKEENGEVLSSTPISSSRRNRLDSSSKNCSHSLLNTQERLQLRSWGLPDSVLKQYERNGVQSMFPWQAECLGVGKVLEGGNLVYSAPTSAGKTLVAELLMLKQVLERKKKAILIFPFVSIAREKMFTIKRLLRDAHVRVGGFMGNQHPRGGFKAVDIAICTIEKANSLVNRLLEDTGSFENLGIVVVDELHLLGDPSRGYLLELLLTKIQYVSSKNGNNEVQIIGMSATLPNLDLLAKWLNADLYKTDFRPVPLSEHIKIGEKLYDNKFNFVRNLNPIVKIQNDTDHLVCLCLETVMNEHSVLVFCPTKNWCEKLAETVAKEFFHFGKPIQGQERDEGKALVRTKLQTLLKGHLLKEVLEQLKRCPAGLDPALAKSISFGVAHHHAGLTFDERDIVEGAFKNGIIKVLIATSTLSSGVNLPARRVIVRCPFTFQNQLMDTLTYRQMIGRAGRKGVDTEGESILLCRESEVTRVRELVTSDLKPVKSCLIQGNGEALCSSMKRAILEVIVSGVASTPDQVEKYASNTLLSAAMEDSASSSQLTENTIESCIKFLQENEFIRLQELGSGLRYAASQLGLACLASSLSPDEGLLVFKELQKARKKFVLENELHIIYQVVPIYAAVGWPNLDWMNYLSIWETLSSDMKRVGELVGVEERFLVRAMRGTVNAQVESQAGLLAIHQRFYTALALNDLVNEMSLAEVSRKYGATKGMLQSLQQAASTFAGMVTTFCSRLGWHNLELLLGQFQDRLQFGIHRELIDLCRISCLNGQRARVLFNSGIDTVAILANSSIADIENLLQNCAPFESVKAINGESEKDAKERKQLRSFWVTGLKGVTEAEAAKMIVEEAREILQKDAGVEILQWGGAGNQGEINSSNASARRRSDSLLSQSAHMSYLRQLQNASANVKRKVTVKRKRKTAAKKKKPKAQTSYEVKVSVASKSNVSFDMSAQIEELFKAAKNEEEEDVFVKPSETVKKQKRVSWGEATEVSPPKVAKVEENHSDNDIFGDSFINIDELEHFENEQKTADRSCPKTPHYDACSEKLEILQAESICDTSICRDFDDTISDSFLERALDSHMSEFEDKLSKSPKDLNIEAVSIARAVSEMSSPGRSPLRSQRLMDRKKQVKKQQKTAVSPGLIFSDSDAELETSSTKNDETPNFEALNVIDVSANRALFETFLDELKHQKSLSISLAVDKSSAKKSDQVQGIGQRITRSRSSNKENECAFGTIQALGVKVTGAAFTFCAGLTAYFVPLCNDIKAQSEMNDTLAPCTQDGSISLPERIKALAIALRPKGQKLVTIFDLRLFIKLMHLGFDITVDVSKDLHFFDPKVATWMLNPGENEMTLATQVMTFRPELSGVLDTLGSSTGKGSVAMTPLAKSNFAKLASPRSRAVAESVLAYNLQEPLSKHLISKGLLKSFQDVEMPSIVILAHMELNGFGFSLDECERQRKVLLARLEELEEKAYALAGRTFSMTSPDDVCKVLYRELRLPINGDKNVVVSHANQKGSSCKEALQKLSSFHELPKLILEWRKLNASVTKVVFPISRAAEHHPGLQMSRIYPECQTFTATGRVSCHEPNIQNIPKDFEVQATPQLLKKAFGSADDSWNANKSSSLLTPYSSFLVDNQADFNVVSLRKAFVASDGRLIVAADYSQLELRILAHLSQDKKLIRVLGPNNPDVFKAIACEWKKKKSPSEVSPTERQQVKQFCYGILYGMGAKSLSEQLNVSYEKALTLMTSFMDTYPAVKEFIERTLSDCEKNGYVTTLHGRRRYLPDIKERLNQHKRTAAERQAINSTVQGSAADLVKKAMIDINSKLTAAFPESKPLRKGFYEKGQSANKDGAHFVLQLHDELYYEACANPEDLVHVAKLIRDCMENAVQLDVPFPVSLKIGPSWGELVEMQLDN